MNMTSRSITPNVLLLLFLLLTLSLAACANTTTETTTAPPTTTESSEETTSLSEEINCSYSISLGVSNSTDQIETEFVLCVAAGETFTADGICFIYDMLANKDSLPQIDLSATMSLVKSNSVYTGTVKVFDAEGVLLDTWNSWDDRTDLEIGQYFVQISTHTSESDCNISGVNIFILNVN